MKHSKTTTESARVITGRPALSVTSSIHQGARDYQEDSLGHWFDAKHQRLFAVVADGAGGHGGGAEASQAAIEFSASAWKQSSNDAFADPPAFLTEWMKNAHRAVNEASAKIHRSARSVVVACLTDGRHAHWVHAGDSRLLRFHESKLAERTRDDSVVQVLFERGEITEEEMGTHPDQSRLLQSLGGEDAPSPRLGSAELEEGDVLILCSDGFWEHLKHDELEQLAATPAAKRQHALDLAVKEAARRAGPKADNTTAIMIHCDGGNASTTSCPCRWFLWLLLAAAMGGLAAWVWKERPTWSAFPALSPQTKPVNPLAVEPTKAPEPTPPVLVKPQPSEADSEDKAAGETPAPLLPGHPDRSQTEPAPPTESAPPIPEP